MELKDFLKRSNLIFTNVTTKLSRVDAQHMFNLINDNKIDVIWKEGEENDYPRIETIEDLDYNSSMNIEIKIKNIL